VSIEEKMKNVKSRKERKGRRIRGRFMWGGRRKVVMRKITKIPLPIDFFIFLFQAV